MKHDNNYGVEVTTDNLIETLERVDKLAKQFEGVTPALLMVIPYIVAEIEVKESRAALYRKWLHILTGSVIMSVLGWAGHFLLKWACPFIILKIKQYLGGL